MNRTYVLKKIRSSRTQNFFIKKAKNNYLRKDRISTQELRKKEKKRKEKTRKGSDRHKRKKKPNEHRKILNN